MTAELPDLDAQELLRYARHLRIPEVGEEGQRKLKAARVLLVGLGGLGSPAAMYLAAAGVGTLGLVEADRVEASNLQRQLLYGQADVGDDKLEAAARRLADLNPHLRIEKHAERFEVGNALELVEAYDIVVDGSDNFPTRYLVNDACVRGGRPNVFGAISRFEGQLSVFGAAGGPCYRCLFPEPPPAGTVPSCAEAGVFGVLPGIVGTLQATEVLKLLLGVGDSLVGRFLMFDALTLRFHEVTIAPSPECPVCSESPSLTELVAYEEVCEVEEEDDAGPLTPLRLQRWLTEGRQVALLDVRFPYEHQICRLDGAQLLPLPELPHRLEELRQLAQPLVVYCHHGIRSAQAVRFLEHAGFEGVYNLEGGIEEWRRTVDPSMPGY